MLKDVFYYIIFPGLIFSVSAGGILSWVDRKLTARLQFRQGPPFLQPFYDIGKLMSKEIILPKYGSKITFLAAPVLALTGAAIASVMILLPAFGISSGFNGDIIVVFYLLAIPSVMYMLGALAGSNPLASIGASREMKLIICYEMVFMLVIAGIIIKSGMSIRISDIIASQHNHIANIGSLSGILLFIASVFCIQAKLGLVPFDVSEAESELMNGLFIELSGPVYALIKMTKYILLFSLPVLVVVLFFGGLDFHGFSILWSLLKIFLVVMIITLIRNTNPRVRIDQAMRFFFIRMNILVICAIILAIFNL